MREREKNDEADEAALAKETHESNEEISKEGRGNQKTYRGEKNHTQRGETTIEKQIKNASGTKRVKRQEEIQRILEDFKGTKNIPGIKSAERRVLITKKKNEKGEVITSRKGIANLFGELTKKNFRRQKTRRN